MNSVSSSVTNSNMDVSFITNRKLRCSLESAICVINNTNSWDSIRMYKNVEFVVDLSFHYYKIDVVTTALKQKHSLTDSTIRRNLEILSYISKNGFEDFKMKYIDLNSPENRVLVKHQ
jgi:hypothetical protein